MVRSADAVARVRPVLEAEVAVRWAYLFGSCARGEAGRDVDLAIMRADGAGGTAVEWGALVAALEGAAGAAVDLVDLAIAPLPLVGTILAQRVVLVDCDPGARHEWEAQQLSRWIDFRPAWERYAQLRLDALQRRLRGAG